MPILPEIQIFLETATGLWLRLLLTAALSALVLKIVFRFASVRLRKITTRTHLTWDDVAVDLLDGLNGFVLFVWCFYALARSIPESRAVEKPLAIVMVLCSVFQVGKWGLYVIRRWNQNFLARRVKTDPSAASALGLLYTSIQALFLIMLVLIGLSNLGVDIRALLAGLGVGGIAVALAAQNVLGDLLASLSIVLDKPFVVGDFIVVGQEMGTVEAIGIKTTRVRSLSGEQLIFANKDLLESRVRNYKRMSSRRVEQKFSVDLDTPPDLLQQIPVWVKEAVERHGDLTYDRCHLARFTNTAYEYELIFIVASPEFNVFMDLQQEVLLEMVRRFRSEGAHLAVPKQNLITEKEWGSPSFHRPPPAADSNLSPNGIP